MCLLCFIVVFLLGYSLYLLLGRTYTIPIAFELYLKGPSLSFGLATPYSIREHQKFSPQQVVAEKIEGKRCYYIDFLVFIFISYDYSTISRVIVFQDL